jgi:hypothetical protein
MKVFVWDIRTKNVAIEVLERQRKEPFVLDTSVIWTSKTTSAIFI